MALQFPKLRPRADQQASDDQNQTEHSECFLLPCFRRISSCYSTCLITSTRDCLEAPKTGWDILSYVAFTHDVVGGRGVVSWPDFCQGPPQALEAGLSRS